MAATEEALGNLHKELAIALTQEVKGTLVEDEKGTRLVRSASMIGAAVAFLKNNNISCDPSENAELANLGKALSARRKGRAAISQHALDEAADLYAASVGSTLQ